MSTATASRRIDPRSLRDADVVLTATPASGTQASPSANFVPALATRQLSITSIRLDGGTQPRAALNQSHINDLADDLRAGAILPPLDVMYDGGNYWLFDGYHRLHAHKLAHGDEASIAVRVHQGSLADAQWASFAVNKSHGLRRTTEDKQRAVVAALRHTNGASRSNREIGRHLGVDDKTVGEWRKRLEASAEIPQMAERTVTRGDQTYTQNTAEIGASHRRESTASGLPKLDIPLRTVGSVVASDATHTRQQNAPLGKCRICNRTLSDPDQAAQGIGSCCAAKQAASLAVDGDRPLPAWAAYDDDDADLTAADVQVLKPMPRADDAVIVMTQAEDKIMSLKRLIGVFHHTIAEFNAYGELTGHHVETLPAKRELEKLIKRLERECALLNGQPVEAWGEEMAA